MIAALRVMVAAWLGWLADITHPNPPVLTGWQTADDMWHIPGDVLANLHAADFRAAWLAEQEAATEVWEPIGEYPDLPTSCRQPPG